MKSTTMTTLLELELLLCCECKLGVLSEYEILNSYNLVLIRFSNLLQNQFYLNNLRVYDGCTKY